MEIYIVARLGGDWFELCYCGNFATAHASLQRFIEIDKQQHGVDTRKLYAIRIRMNDNSTYLITAYEKEYNDY